MASRKVSIVLPTHNGSRYIRDSVHSCLQQTYTDFELTIVDDGSTDGTREILATFVDPRVTVVSHTQNRGLPESLNTGFAKSTGDLLTWTSDDNLYLPCAIEVLATALEKNNGVDLVYSSYNLIDESGRITGRVDALPPERLWETNVVGASFMYTRQVFDTIGQYNPSERTIEDYDYWLRVSRRFRMLALPDVLYRYREHPSSLTARLNVMDRARRAADLKYRLGGTSRRQLGRELATIDMAESFQCYWSKQYNQVPRLVWSGLVRNPSYVLNRGVLSILVKSLVRGFTRASTNAQS